MDVKCLTEKQVFAISTFLTNQIAECIEGADELSLVADIITAIGDTLTLISGQRARFQQNCKPKKNTPANAAPLANTTQTSATQSSS